jgi:phage gpG-like protein
MPINNNTPQFDALLKDYREVRKQVPVFLGNEAVKFFKDGMRREGVVDGRFKPWPKRAGPPKDLNRRSLRKSGRLFRSIRVLRKGKNDQIVIGPGAESRRYAELMNNGGKITVTPKMRKFFWAMYFKEAGSNEKKYGDSVRDSDIRKFVKESANADFWKNLALAKTITVPPRPFIYQSRTLQIQLTNLLTDRLNKALQKPRS